MTDARTDQLLQAVRDAFSHGPCVSSAANPADFTYVEGVRVAEMARRRGLRISNRQIGPALAALERRGLVESAYHRGWQVKVWRLSERGAAQMWVKEKEVAQTARERERERKQ